MSMTTTEVSVFEGRWGQRTYVFGLNEAEVKEKVVSHFAFGDPEEDEYAIGNVWATPNDSEGWRVVECTLAVSEIDGEKSGDTRTNETAHVNWKCPNCNQSFSEEYFEGDEAPLLVKCGCNKKEKYFLIRF